MAKHLIGQSRGRVRRVGGIVGAGLLASAVFGVANGRADASPSGSSLLAYVGGGAASPTSCPITTTVRRQCTLVEALGLATPGSTVFLATPGSTSSYFGDFSIDTAGTSPSAPVTISPAFGVVAPVQDGD